MSRSDYDETRAVAHLPSADVEILHRRAWDGREEQMSITLRAIPSFEALDRAFALVNPFAFWTRLLQNAWAPWLNGLIGSALPRGDSRPGGSDHRVPPR